MLCWSKIYVMFIINLFFGVIMYNIMGIKNFMKIIQKYADEAITYNKINKYKDTVMGIDGNLMIYKMVYAIRKNGYDIKNGDIIVTHLNSLLLKIIGFVKYNITPVFVFDGIQPKMKEKTLKRRKEFQKSMKKKYYNAITQDEKKKYYFMKSDITFQEIQQCIELIRVFNFTVIESIEEADSQLSDLSKKKVIDYIVTDDMDILIFGGANILKNFTISDKKKIQEISLNIIKEQTEMNQHQLVDLAILLGCDYCPTIKGIGPIGAYKLMKKYGDIKEIIKNEPIKIGAVEYKYKKIRNYFLNPPVINYKSIKITKFKYDKMELETFLKKFNYKNDYIDSLISKI